MRNGKERVVTICPVDSPEGFELGCEDCGTILRRGKFAVGIVDGEHRYFVCDDEPVFCCGKELHVPLLYDDEKRREKERQKIIQRVKDDGRLDFISLFELNEEDYPTLH